MSQEDVKEIITADKTTKKQFAATVNSTTKDITTEGGLHRLGQLLLRAQLPEMAADAFERKELSALRPMTSNRAMRSLVQQLGDTHSVKVCDLASSLAANSPDGIPGNDVFIDHCHPNSEGHKVLGAALANCILDLGIGGLSHPTQKIRHEETNPLRFDHYTGHRHIPGYKSNPKRPETPQTLTLTTLTRYLLHIDGNVASSRLASEFHVGSTVFKQDS